MQTPSRKGPSREHGNATRFIPNNLPALTPEAKSTVVREWSRGCPMRRISQNQGLSQPQVEAVIWERFVGFGPRLVGNSQRAAA